MRDKRGKHRLLHAALEMPVMRDKFCHDRIFARKVLHFLLPVVNHAICLLIPTD